MASGVAHQYYAPADDIERQVLGDWDPLNDKIGRIFADEDGDVDAGR